MTTLKASEYGLAKIKLARKEKGWTIDDPKWLIEASKELEPNRSWEEVGPYAIGISLPTWRRFLAGKQPIKADAFKAYCKILGFNWEEIVERTLPLFSIPTDTDSTNLKDIFQHSNVVRSVTISPDSKILVSASDDNTIKIWNLHSGALLHTLPGHTSYVCCVAISPDGQFFVSSSCGGTTRFWNLHSGEQLNSQSIQVIAISSDWQTVASIESAGTINFLKLDGVKLHCTGSTFPVEDTTWVSVAISPDSQTLAVVRYRGKLVLWNLPNKKMLPSLKCGIYLERSHIDGFSDVAIAPDNQTIVCVGFNQDTRCKYIALGNLHSNEWFQVIELPCQISSSITISNDGQILSVGFFDGTIKVWKLHSGELLRTFNGHSASVRCIALSPDSRTLVSGSDDGTIRIWNL